MNRASAKIIALLAWPIVGAACRPAGVADDGAAAGLPLGIPSDVGMSEERLARIRPAMQAYVDDGRLAGVMTMVARRGQVVHWEAVGMRDLAAGDPLEPDTSRCPSRPRRSHRR